MARRKCRRCAKQRRAARGRPPLRSCHVRFRYRRRGCPPRSIRIAATLRQTAAPHASVKSEIHMASLVLLSTSLRSFPRARSQRRSRPSVPGTLLFNSGKIAPFVRKNVCQSGLRPHCAGPTPDTDRKRRQQAGLLTSYGRCATIPAAAFTCSRPPIPGAAPPGFVVRVQYPSPDVKTGARAAPVTRP